MNVLNKENVVKTFGEIEKILGTIFIAVNNAGVSSMEKIEEMNEEQWDYNMDNNAKGVFICAQEAVRSVAAKYGLPGLIHYSASKAAVLRFYGFNKS